MIKKIYIFIVLLSPLILIDSALGGEITIDRVWSDNGYGYALVTYKNNTNIAFKSVVTIKCTALDSDGNKININSRSFFSFEHGPINPGFEGTLKIPINLHGLKLNSISCGCLEQ